MKPATARRLVELIRQGNTNREISEITGFTAATVKSYISILAAEVGAKSRGQLVYLSDQRGLVRRP